jgi:hypothetical protein
VKNKPPAAVDLTWSQVHAFRLSRHHLLGRAPKKDLARVVGDIGGAQAQLMSAAELQVGVRVDCTVDDVRAALWKTKKLVKTWLMRGTLHLLPAVDLPVFTAALGARWMHPTKAWLKWTELSELELVALFEGIGQALADDPMTREELIAAVSKNRSLARSERVQAILKSGWGTILKPVARKGLLCFGPSRGQSVTFVRPESWLGSWRVIDHDAALIEVGRRYLSAYGPATKDDFRRWLGQWSGVGKAVWAGLAAELTPVSIEGRRADVLTTDVRTIAKMADDSAVHLLPGFDPYLMGHSSRDHMFDSAHRWKVSRVSGWISPVVLVGGRVVATWSHVVVKKTLRISVAPFQRLAPRTVASIRARAHDLASTLGLMDVDVKVS